MKKNILGLLFLAILAYSQFQAVDPNNPPTGRTGAPTENTCQASDCHKGGSFTGNVDISGLPDTIIAGTKYTVTLTQTSNAVRGGFEMTVLDGLNKKAGTFTVGQGSSKASALGREYIRQATPRDLANGSVSWTFNWTAPAALTAGAADTVKFYFVSLAANGNGKESLDNVLINAKKKVFAISTANHDVTKPDWTLDYNPFYKSLTIGNNNGQAKCTIFTMNGKKAFDLTFSESNKTINLDQLNSGVYIVNLESKNGSSARKINVL